MATQSVASLAALSDSLDFSKEPKSLLETFLYAAAFSPRPSGELLHLVLVSMDISLSSPRVLHLGWIHTPWDKENVSVESDFPAHGIVLCAFNGTLVVGADSPRRKRIQQKTLCISALEIIKS